MISINNQSFVKSTGLDPTKACEVVQGLNDYLSNLNVLYIKLHNFHWNVVGISFFDIHEKTQMLYEAVALKSDMVAERILALGYRPLATMHDYLRTATIGEAPSESYTGTTVAQILLDDFACIIMLLREIAELAKENNDECTVGLVAEHLCFFEKHSWMLRAYLTR